MKRTFHHTLLLRKLVLAMLALVVGCGPDVENAAMQTTPADGYVPLTVTFSGSAKVNVKDANKVTYTWNFGDSGTTLMGTNVTHEYETPGVYTAQLVVATDGDRTIATASINAKAIPKPDSPGIFAMTKGGLVPLLKRNETYASIVDGSQSMFTVFISDAVYEAVRPARVTKLVKSDLLCILVNRVRHRESLSFHSVSTLSKQDYRNDRWRHRDGRGQLCIEAFPTKYTHKIADPLPMESKDSEPGLSRVVLGDLPLGLYVAWIDKDFWYFELVEEAGPLPDPNEDVQTLEDMDEGR